MKKRIPPRERSSLIKIFDYSHVYALGTKSVLKNSGFKKIDVSIGNDITGAFDNEVVNGHYKWVFYHLRADSKMSLKNLCFLRKYFPNAIIIIYGSNFNAEIIKEVYEHGVNGYYSLSQNEDVFIDLVMDCKIGQLIISTKAVKE